MTDGAIVVLAAALHENDDTCNANYVIPFAECGAREWDVNHAREVLETLRSMGWRLAQEPAGTVPLWEASA